MSGAGSGIGRLMSIKFAELGAIVICTDLNAETAEQTANTIKCKRNELFKYSSRTEVFPWDIGLFQVDFEK